MKKTISLLLLLIIILTPVFASCAEKNAGTDENSSEKPISSDETTKPSEYVSPGVKYDGADFTTWGHSSSWSIISHICESFEETESSDPIETGIFRRNAKVENELEVKIKFLQLPEMSAYNKIASTIMAGDYIANMISCTGNALYEIMKSPEALLNLKNIENLNMDASWWNERSIEEFTFYNQTYAMTGHFNLGFITAVEAIFFNKMLISDLNLENPYELADKNEWTLDKMFEMAQNANKDLNNDGKFDENDRYGIGHSDGIHNLYFACGGRLTKRDNAGDITLVAADESNIDIFNKVRDYVIQPQNCLNKMGAQIFTQDKILFYPWALIIGNTFRNMETDYGIIPMPKQNEAQQDYISVCGRTGTTYTSVPTTLPVKYYDMTGDVMNALGYYAQQLVTPEVIDRTIYYKIGRGDEDAIRMINIIYSNTTFDICSFFGWGNVFDAFTETMTNTNSWQRVIDTKAKGFNSSLKKTLSKLEV
ncbi:MAG: hypothetical protein PUE85_07245 [Firmicutes bacterium]|nr:hypothetical protein [Bacillota bacterium]